MLEVYISHSVSILLFLEKFCSFEIFQKKELGRLPDLFDAFTYIETRKTGGKGRLGVEQGKKSVLFWMFQRPCNSQMFRDETEKILNP